MNQGLDRHLTFETTSWDDSTRHVLSVCKAYTSSNASGWGFGSYGGTKWIRSLYITLRPIQHPTTPKFEEEDGRILSIWFVIVFDSQRMLHRRGNQWKIASCIDVRFFMTSLAGFVRFRSCAWLFRFESTKKSDLLSMCSYSHILMIPQVCLEASCIPKLKRMDLVKLFIYPHWGRRSTFGSAPKLPLLVEDTSHFQCQFVAIPTRLKPPPTQITTFLETLTVQIESQLLDLILGKNTINSSFTSFFGGHHT